MILLNKRYWIIGLICLAWLSACNLPSAAPPATSPTLENAVDVEGTTPAAGAATEPTTVATATALPHTLTICSARQPDSLFLYGDNSLAARQVRQAIYDGPYDVVAGEIIPVIFDAIPTLENGGVVIQRASVKPGDVFSDADGRIVTLAEGVRYLPAGCRSAECVQTYSGSDAIELDQMVVRFKLRQGISWSDGAPLTADDSRYSFEVATALFPAARAELLARTQSYQALDSYTLEWRGMAGYRSAQYATFFFDPLPRHAWGSLSVESLAAEEAVARFPLGWGAYLVEAWEEGGAILLRRNPNYWRAAEGLPYFSELLFRVMADRQAALQALQAGECDLLDESFHLDWAVIQQVQSTANFQALKQASTAWMHLTFNLQPLSAENALLAQKGLRQALAGCINRQQLVEEIFSGQADLASSFLPVEHPLAGVEITTDTYDPAAASAQIEAMGWVDADNDPATPRLARGVVGVADGSPLQLSLLTTDDPTGRQTADLLGTSLAGCGVKVEVQALPMRELLASGADGPVFGRRFQLAIFAWQTALESPCALYTSGEIPGTYPTAQKGWGGANAGGYANPEYDQNCALALAGLPGEVETGRAHQRVQEIFAEDLPALPLYFLNEYVAAGANLCGPAPQPLGRSSLWNLEAWAIGPSCQVGGG